MATRHKTTTRQLQGQGYSSSSVMLAYWARSASFLFLDSSDTSFDFTTIWACFSIMLAMAWTSATAQQCKTNHWRSIPWLAVKVDCLFISIVLVLATQERVLATNFTECTILHDYARRKGSPFSDRSGTIWKNNTCWYRHFFHTTKRKLSAISGTVLLCSSRKSLLRIKLSRTLLQNSE